MTSSNNQSSLSTEKSLASLLSNTNDDFSVASYLNTALDLTKYPPAQQDSSTSSANNDEKEEDEDEMLQRRMAELALQLQVQTQSCHDDIGRIGAELRAILPRCAADLGRLGLGIEGMEEDASTLLESHLQSSLAHTTGNTNNDDADSDEHLAGEGEGGGDVKKESTDDEENGQQQDENVDPNLNNASNGSTNNSNTMTPLETLETLSTLHALRTNLTLTKQILTAAASWDSTMSSIPSLLSSSSSSSTSVTTNTSSNTTSLADAVTALTTLESGAKALSGMPGKQSRYEAIQSIRSQIQVLLKPQLLHALQRMETRLGPLQSCVSMYAKLGKMDTLVEEYVRSRPVSVHKLWFEFKSGLMMNKSTSAAGDVSGPSATKKSNQRADELEFYTDGDEEKSPSQDDFHITSTSQKATDNVADNPAIEFVEWLPTWYEAVLLLLGEERRRAVIVFGADLAPEIIAKVLNECFRPILSSFQTRLSAIYSPDEDSSVTSTSSGSFESICATYESTLQFLSIAYEQMVEFDGATTALSGGKTDGFSTVTTSADGGSAMKHMSSNTPVQVFMMIRSIFVTIGSAFAPYQAKFAQLEKKHSELAGKIVSKDIQDAVMSGGKNVALSSLQDSVERLAGLASFMFPLAQAAIARYESLNSGYWAENALATIDSLVSHHVREMSIAINTLSTNLFSNQAHLSDTFDEQQVLCALEVLKIAGVIRRDLNLFQEKTRDRLRILLGRMSATIDQHNALMDAMTQNSFTTSIIPDSLSAVEIEALLAKSVCGDSEDDSKSKVISKLQRLANADKSVDDVMTLFPDSYDSTSRLIRTCQTFVFDVCSAIPLRHLDLMTSLSVWREESSSSSLVDSYGTLPQSYITHVGEHMLALVQALEPFASNEDALQLANFAMERVELVGLQSWKDFANVTNSADPSDVDTISLLAGGENVKDYVLSNMHHFEVEDDEEEDGNDDSNTKSAVFCNQWLDVVCSAVTGRLMEQTMRIHHVSQKGCDHLAADYNYLINVLSALGVSGHPHPLLNHVVGILKLNSDDLQARITMSNNDNSVTGMAVRNTDTRLALMKGIDIN